MDYSLKDETIERFLGQAKGLIFPHESNGYKSRFLQSNILLYFIIALLALKIVSIAVSINFPHNIFFADITKSALENFVNQTRQSSGLPPLAENPKLNQAAKLKAENMVQNQYFAHTSPSGITPWHWFLQAGYDYKYAGENLAVGFFDSQEVYNAWLNSPSHKANILNPNYKEMGTAVLSGFGQSNTIVVVQEFASPKTTAPAKTVEPKILSKVAVPGTLNSLQSPGAAVENNLPLRVFNSVKYNYDSFLQNITYGVSMVVIGVLLALIFFNFRISFKKELVFRAVIIVVLLSAATLINKEIIVSLIPHQMMI